MNFEIPKEHWHWLWNQMSTEVLCASPRQDDELDRGPSNGEANWNKTKNLVLAKLCIRTEKFRFKTTDDMFHIPRFQLFYILFILRFFNVAFFICIIYFHLFILYVRGNTITLYFCFRKEVFKITEAHQK